MKKTFPKDRYEVKTIALRSLQQALTAQGAKPANQMREFNPHVQFIISNSYYEAAALKAMEQAPAAAAFICPTGLGGWSLEMQYDDEDAINRVQDVYNAECDAMGLY